MKSYWEALFWVTWLYLLIDFASWVNWRTDRWYVKITPLWFLILACWASSTGI